jgi:hypothetical protein
MATEAKALTTEEKEEVVMQYFGMNERDELAQMVLSRMGKLKSNFMTVINNITRLMNKTDIDVFATREKVNELNKILDKYEFNDHLHDELIMN